MNAISIVLITIGSINGMMIGKDGYPTPSIPGKPPSVYEQLRIVLQNLRENFDGLEDREYCDEESDSVSESTKARWRSIQRGQAIAHSSLREFYAQRKEAHGKCVFTLPAETKILMGADISKIPDLLLPNGQRTTRYKAQIQALLTALPKLPTQIETKK